MGEINCTFGTFVKVKIQEGVIDKKRKKITGC